MTGETKSDAQKARSYGLGASGLKDPGSAPYSTLLSLLSWHMLVVLENGDITDLSILSDLGYKR
jgi:hypothetical protein